ncbi:PPOX class probable F420-dependent enzyme [Streptomyces sp. DvalAA-14]|uniref:PPOX class F420-dependent oxidoreductase n=1 Tax=unclassified Streptomyces TaxID=2593676 RepID=UPI00081B174A|nr:MULTISPECIES: PPOX class F420-dependent oxidoreductase [unclassified Streptomyces]MYS23393.1 TIGR03618 family F420-dependent PPOX class oxidoreductase [Streptomyces sp. SID4948]SCE32583.1 PPOX class probable F420-dependent enzyme [Streptomyces sp. DvalAA-14]
MPDLSDSARALIDANSYATVGTIEPDGQPQLSLVWVTREGDDVVFSTLASRRKHANLDRDPRITLLITLPEAPYAYLEIRGTATMDTEGGDKLINDLSLKYTGKPYTSDLPGAVRVVVRVTAGHVVEHG